MSGFKGIAREKKKAVDAIDDRIARLVLKAQSKIMNDVIREVASQLELDGQIIKPTFRNANIAGKIDTIMKQWERTHGRPLANSIAKSVVKVNSLNADYFRKTANFIPANKLSNQLDKTTKSTLKRYGIKVGRKAITAESRGYIFSSVMNNQMNRSVKSQFSNAILSKAPLGKLKSNLFSVFGEGESAGIFERVMSESLPHPALNADRETNLQIATGLELNHAFYQGGVITTTRDFCDERNDKVFSRDEIANFGTSADIYGGYTNKSAGEFQGKPKVYNPFTDVGGYNCRHSLDWISDDLAKIYRPDLFTDVE